MSAALLSKLKHKSQDVTLIINRPDGVTFGELQFDSGIEYDMYDFILFFAERKADLDIHIPTIARVAKPDATFWVGYPKKSGKIESNITRDEGWDILNAIGFRTVSQVAIDEDWSALRIKPVNEVINKKSGSKVIVELAEDKSERKVNIPSELMELLNSEPEIKEFYESLSYTNQKEYANWIRAAKREETKEKRLNETRQRLSQGIKNPFAK